MIIQMSSSGKYCRQIAHPKAADTRKSPKFNWDIQPRTRMFLSSKCTRVFVIRNGATFSHFNDALWCSHISDMTVCVMCRSRWLVFGLEIEWHKSKKKYCFCNSKVDAFLRNSCAQTEQWKSTYTHECTNDFVHTWMLPSSHRRKTSRNIVVKIIIEFMHNLRFSLRIPKWYAFVLTAYYTFNCDIMKKSTCVTMSKKKKKRKTKNPRFQRTATGNKVEWNA